MSASNDECRFCVDKPGRQLIKESKYGFAIWDRHPASDGHFLVIARRHVASYFDTEEDERNDLWKLVADCQIVADEKWKPDGYTVGINVGEAAGQSIPHLHIHVIPRYKGDVENPKGGVRGVIPERKLYKLIDD